MKNTIKLFIHIAVMVGIVSTQNFAKDFTDYKMYPGKEYVCTTVYKIDPVTKKETELSPKEQLKMFATMSKDEETITIRGYGDFKFLRSRNGFDIYTFTITDSKGMSISTDLSIRVGKDIGKGMMAMPMIFRIYTDRDKTLLAYSGACANQRWSQTPIEE